MLRFVRCSGLCIVGWSSLVGRRAHNPKESRQTFLSYLVGTRPQKLFCTKFARSAPFCARWDRRFGAKVLNRLGGRLASLWALPHRAFLIIDEAGVRYVMPLGFFSGSDASPSRSVPHRCDEQTSGVAYQCQLAAARQSSLPSTSTRRTVSAHSWRPSSEWVAPRRSSSVTAASVEVPAAGLT